MQRRRRRRRRRCRRRRRRQEATVHLRLDSSRPPSRVAQARFKRIEHLGSPFALHRAVFQPFTPKQLVLFLLQWILRRESITYESAHCARWAWSTRPKCPFTMSRNSSQWDYLFRSFNSCNASFSFYDLSCFPLVLTPAKDNRVNRV